jgi:hypothetical protein
MKTSVNFCLYLDEFFLEREMFKTKVVEKIKVKAQTKMLNKVFLF